MTTTAAAIQEAPTNPSIGGRLVATDGRALPLRGASLTVDARGGLARTVLVQHFANVHAEPLTVTYLFPLPHDGAVNGFAFEVGNRRVVGEVDRLQAARERFEEALMEGRSAAMLEQERGSLFTQSVGNVPPGQEVTVELTIDQRLAWSNGQWEWRFPTAVAPRYAGAPETVPDARRSLVDVAEAEIAPRLSLSLVVRDPLSGGRQPESASHGILVLRDPGAARVVLAGDGGVPLDRDVVVRWPVAVRDVETSIDTFAARTGRLEGRAFGLLTLTPPDTAATIRSTPRDLVVLLDTSGSMSGRPIEQAKAIVSGIVQSLGESDTLELVSFSNAPRRWRASPTSATAEAKKDALRWLHALQASGSTEMKDAILAALRPLRGDAQRQVVLVTDGLIGSEEEVVATVLAKLPAQARLHCVGVGDAVNRSLTAPAARAGRGLEVVVGIDESPVAAANALVARTAEPLVTGIEVSGAAVAGGAPMRLADLFGQAPVLVPLELRAAGGELTVRGTTATGPFERRVAVAAVERGVGNPAAASFFAREAVEALEMRLAGGTARTEIDPAIEKLGLDFQISTRLTAWIAVSEEPTVDPGAPFRRERMPQALPYGMSAEGLGLRQQRWAPSASMDGSEDMVLYSMSPDKAMGPKPSPPPAAARGASPPTKRISAQYSWAGGNLVLTVEVGEVGITWTIPAEVTLLGVHGQRVTAAADHSHSTAPGRIEPGQSIRLTIPWSGSDRPRLLVLVMKLEGRVRRLLLEEM